MMQTTRRTHRLVPVLALAVFLSGSGCQQRQVEDENAADGSEAQIDETGQTSATGGTGAADQAAQMDADTAAATAGGADTAGAAGAGGTTLNFETGTATTGQSETKIGGVSSGGLTTREGAAAGGGTGTRDTSDAADNAPAGGTRPR